MAPVINKCDLCNVFCTSKPALDTHCKSAGHLQKVKVTAKPSTLSKTPATSERIKPQNEKNKPPPSTNRKIPQKGTTSIKKPAAKQTPTKPVKSQPAKDTPANKASQDDKLASELKNSLSETNKNAAEPEQQQSAAGSTEVIAAAPISLPKTTTPLPVEETLESSTEHSLIAESDSIEIDQQNKSDTTSKDANLSQENLTENVVTEKMTPEPEQTAAANFGSKDTSTEVGKTQEVTKTGHSSEVEETSVFVEQQASDSKDSGDESAQQIQKKDRSSDLVIVSVESLSTSDGTAVQNDTVVESTEAPSVADKINDKKSEDLVEPSLTNEVESPEGDANESCDSIPIEEMDDLDELEELDNLNELDTLDEIDNLDEELEELDKFVHEVEMEDAAVTDDPKTKDGTDSVKATPDAKKQSSHIKSPKTDHATEPKKSTSSDQRTSKTSSTHSKSSSSHRRDDKHKSGPKESSRSDSRRSSSTDKHRSGHSGSPRSHSDRRSSRDRYRATSSRQSSSRSRDERVKSRSSSDKGKGHYRSSRESERAPKKDGITTSSVKESAEKVTEDISDDEANEDTIMDDLMQEMDTDGWEVTDELDDVEGFDDDDEDLKLLEAELEECVKAVTSDDVPDPKGVGEVSPQQKEVSRNKESAESPSEAEKQVLPGEKEVTEQVPPSKELVTPPKEPVPTPKERLPPPNETVETDGKGAEEKETVKTTTAVPKISDTPPSEPLKVDDTKDGKENAEVTPTVSTEDKDLEAVSPEDKDLDAVSTDDKDLEEDDVVGGLEELEAEFGTDSEDEADTAAKTPATSEIPAVSFDEDTQDMDDGELEQSITKALDEVAQFLGNDNVLNEDDDSNSIDLKLDDADVEAAIDKSDLDSISSFDDISIMDSPDNRELELVSPDSLSDILTAADAALNEIACIDLDDVSDDSDIGVSAESKPPEKVVADTKHKKKGINVATDAKLNLSQPVVRVYKLNFSHFKIWTKPKCTVRLSSVVRGSIGEKELLRKPKRPVTATNKFSKLTSERDTKNRYSKLEWSKTKDSSKGKLLSKEVRDRTSAKKSGDTSNDPINEKLAKYRIPKLNSGEKLGRIPKLKQAEKPGNSRDVTKKPGEGATRLFGNNSHGSGYKRSRPDDNENLRKDRQNLRPDDPERKKMRVSDSRTKRYSPYEVRHVPKTDVSPPQGRQERGVPDRAVGARPDPVKDRERDRMNAFNSRERLPSFYSSPPRDRRSMSPPRQSRSQRRSRSPRMVSRSPPPRRSKSPRVVSRSPSRQSRSPRRRSRSPAWSMRKSPQRGLKSQTGAERAFDWSTGLPLSPGEHSTPRTSAPDIPKPVTTSRLPRGIIPQMTDVLRNIIGPSLGHPRIRQQPQRLTEERTRTLTNVIIGAGTTKTSGQPHTVPLSLSVPPSATIPGLRTEVRGSSDGSWSRPTSTANIGVISEQRPHEFFNKPVQQAPPNPWQQFSKPVEPSFQQSGSKGDHHSQGSDFASQTVKRPDCQPPQSARSDRNTFMDMMKVVAGSGSLGGGTSSVSMQDMFTRMLALQVLNQSGGSGGGGSSSFQLDALKGLLSSKVSGRSSEAPVRESISRYDQPPPSRPSYSNESSVYQLSSAPTHRQEILAQTASLPNSSVPGSALRLSSTESAMRMLDPEQKVQIAQQLAAVLTVTGHSAVSEDLLERLVQQAIVTKAQQGAKQPTGETKSVPTQLSNQSNPWSENSAKATERELSTDMYSTSSSRLGPASSSVAEPTLNVHSQAAPGRVLRSIPAQSLSRSNTSIGENTALFEQALNQKTSYSLASDQRQPNPAKFAHSAATSTPYSVGASAGMFSNYQAPAGASYSDYSQSFNTGVQSGSATRMPQGGVPNPYQSGSNYSVGSSDNYGSQTPASATGQHGTPQYPPARQGYPFGTTGSSYQY